MRLNHPFWFRSVVGRYASLPVFWAAWQNRLTRQDMKTALAHEPALSRLEASRER